MKDKNIHFIEKARLDCNRVSVNEVVVRILTENQRNYGPDLSKELMANMVANNIIGLGCLLGNYLMNFQGTVTKSDILTGILNDLEYELNTFLDNSQLVPQKPTLRGINGGLAQTTDS